MSSQVQAITAVQSLDREKEQQVFTRIFREMPQDSLEEIEDARGYFYYQNSKTKIKYKENPSLILIIKKIKTSYSDVKYSSYRSAIKIMQLKSSLYSKCQISMNRDISLVADSKKKFVYVILAFSIPFRSAISIIMKHKSGSSQDVSPAELTNIIHDIFFANEKAGFYVEHKNFNLGKAISILCNFLWNIFDPKRQQNISLMELKLAMLILCELPPINTYHQLIDAHFDIAKDHNNCITRSRFEDFINVTAKLLSYLGEPLYFERQTVSEIVNEVFHAYTGLNGMNQFTFMNLWTSHDSTKFSAYTNLFLLLIRFKKSEQVVHRNQCSSCNEFPIVGMRFKCLKCRSLSLCFTCFSKGFVNQRHSLAHRMTELNSNEKDLGKLCKLFSSFVKMFRRQPHVSLQNPAISSVFATSKSQIVGDTKLIENEHVELSHVDDDMEGGTGARLDKSRRIIRSEVYNNSENLLILQRSLMEKFLSAIENIKLESENYQNSIDTNKAGLATVPDIAKFVNLHNAFLIDYTNELKLIHETMMSSFSSSQNNKTIKSGHFSSPTTSLFLPHSSTPYRAEKTNAKENIPLELALCKSSKS